MKYDQYLLEAAEYVRDEYKNNGKFDLNCEEIAKGGIMGGKAPSPGLITDIRQNLRVLIKILRDKHTIELVMSVGSNYYLPLREVRRRLGRDATFRDRPPESIKECRFCAPLGQGKRSWGLYIAHGKNDLLWQVLNEHHTKSTSNSTKHAIKRVVMANKAGHMRLRPAKERAKETLETVKPDNLADLGQLGNGEGI